MYYKYHLFITIFTVTMHYSESHCYMLPGYHETVIIVISFIMFLLDNSLLSKENESDDEEDEEEKIQSTIISLREEEDAQVKRCIYCDTF